MSKLKKKIHVYFFGNNLLVTKCTKHLITRNLAKISVLAAISLLDCVSVLLDFWALTFWRIVFNCSCIAFKSFSNFSWRDIISFSLADLSLLDGICKKNIYREIPSKIHRWKQDNIYRIQCSLSNARIHIHRFQMVHRTGVIEFAGQRKHWFHTIHASGTHSQSPSAKKKIKNRKIKANRTFSYHQISRTEVFLLEQLKRRRDLHKALHFYNFTRRKMKLLWMYEYEELLKNRNLTILTPLLCLYTTNLYFQIPN